MTPQVLQDSKVRVYNLIDSNGIMATEKTSRRKKTKGKPGNSGVMRKTAKPNEPPQKEISVSRLIES